MSKHLQTPRKFVRITRSIKRRISTGQLGPGQKLPAEREMARQCKCSRVSVREAYRSLEELGLLTIRRGADGGAFVSRPSSATLQDSLALILRIGQTSEQELSEARVVGLTIARLAARHAEPQDIMRLKQALERDEIAVATYGCAALPGLQFQRALAACARNRPLTALMNALTELTADALLSLHVRSSAVQRLCRFQRGILAAVERHDEKSAHRFMLRHTGSVWQLIAATQPPCRPARPLAGKR
jgi:GntR family transcriptional regulator, transcriptional repressor for pyruvate dehydrogenase complex